MSHFVYIYRDASGKACYIGYGQSNEAAFERMSQIYNKRLRELTNSKSLTLEIAGPYDSGATALAVESALLSAIVPAASSHGGQMIHRFRPVGVPPQFAERVAMAPLGRDDLIEILDAANSPSFLCVHLADIDFVGADGIARRGYDPSHPPSDAEIVERVTRWWRLETRLADWRRHPMQSPAILLAIHGDLDHQFVFASLATDRDNWDAATRSAEDETLYEVPIQSSRGLDVAALRGRRIGRKVGLKFNADGVKMFP